MRKDVPLLFDVFRFYSRLFKQAQALKRQYRRERDAAMARSGAKSVALENLRAELAQVKAERDAALSALASFSRTAQKAEGTPTLSEKLALARAEQAELDALVLSRCLIMTSSITDKEFDKGIVIARKCLDGAK